MDKIIQYILVRSDLEMSYGKFAAQVSHASLRSVLPHQEDPSVKEWMNGQFTKVVLRVKSFQQLVNTIKRLEVDGIEHSAIWDACHTELTPESKRGTLTCVGLKPCSKSHLKPYIGKYQLY